jgi:prolyl 4-hydroxylase
MAMARNSLADHIRVYPDALSAQHCATLIERFEAAPELELCQRQNGHSFTQLDVSQHWPDQHQALVPVFVNFINQYQLALDARFWPPRFALENLRLKRYLPNGRDCFPTHVDVMGQEASRRFMTAFIYLNTPAGGETVFPTLDLSVAAETGKLIAFPPLWLFPHAGLPPRLGPKYILHTYICYPPPDAAG